MVMILICFHAIELHATEINVNFKYISLIWRNCVVMAGHGITDENKIKVMQAWTSPNASPLELE